MKGFKNGDSDTAFQRQLHSIENEEIAAQEEMSEIEGTHRDSDEMSILEMLMNEANIDEIEVDNMYGLQPESDSDSNDSS